jgi:chromosome segregation ATPase
MRDEYLKERGFNPVKVGLIGALVVAAVVFAALQYNSYVANREAKEQALSAAMEQISKLEADNGKLKDAIADLEKGSKASEEKLKKQLQQKDSLLSNTKQQMNSESRDADSKLAQLKKDKAQLESQLADLKKESDDNAKMLRDQIAKLQSDVKTARLESDRNAKNASVLKAKLDKINEGDQSAADAMVQQLADLQQKLKKEQATRQKLEEDLDQLRKQNTPQ